MPEHDPNRQVAPPIRLTDANVPMPPPLPTEPVDAIVLVEPPSPHTPVTDAPNSGNEAPSDVNDPNATRHGPIGRVWRWLASTVEWLVGLACIVVGVAMMAAIPVLQFLSLGYLLEVAGRIAREQKLSSGFIGIRKAARVGFLLAHSWLMFVPLRIVSDYWHDAQLLDPNGAITTNLRNFQLFLTIATLIHVISAWYSGGKARHFYWPILAPWYIVRSLIGNMTWSDWFPPARLLRDYEQGGMYQRARDGVWDFVMSLRLPYYFRLGAVGLVGAILWLAAPVLFLAGAAALPPGAATIAGFIGGILLAAVAVRLPFMEANFAATGNWRMLLDRKLAGQQFSRAPLAFWFAMLLTLALAIPLHLVQAAPPILAELSWLLNVLFVLLLLPARFITGWAVSRAERREEARFIGSRIGARLASVPVALFYALVVYLSQFINYYGSWRLLEQPAFMLPAPFWLIG